MKKAILFWTATLCAGVLSAGTYAWRGGDGPWFDAANWNYDGAPAAVSPGNAPADDVVIDGPVTVTYVPGGDWLPTGATTISGGATLVQADGGAWPNIRGAVTLDGGTYDTGSAGSFRLGGTMTIRNGGALFVRTGQQNTDGKGLIVMEDGGLLERFGGWAGAIPLTLNGGRVSVAGVCTTHADDKLFGGELTMTGEFHPHGGLIVDGTVVTCPLFAPQGADKIVSFASGGLVCTSSNHDGFYQGSGVYVDIPAGSLATFTMPVAAADVYPKYFSNGKFRHAGETVSETDFADLFIVEAVDGTHAKFYLANAGASYAFGTTAASDVTGSSAVLSAALRKVGEGEGQVVVAWGTDPDALDLTAGERLGAADAEGTVFQKTIGGLSENTAYHYVFGVLVDGAVAAQSAVRSFYASDYAAVFLGTESDSAATAANWSSGAVPSAGDRILIAADCTWDVAANVSFAEWDITIDGAALALTGEVNPAAARTVRDGALTATVFVGSGKALEVRGSRLVSTTTGRWGGVPRGFYSSAPFFNFHSGAACSYTYTYDPEGAVPTEADEFAALFTAGRILVDGMVLTDASRVQWTIDETACTVTATLKESAVEASFAAASSAEASGLQAVLSVTVEVGGGRPLYVLTGTDPADLTETLVAEAAEDGRTYTFETDGAEGTLVYWLFRLGDAETGLPDAAEPQTFFASASGNLWTGAKSDRASVAENWSRGRVPGSDDLVYFVADATDRTTLQWDLANAVVGGWRQTGGRVNFSGTPNDALTIAGDAVLSGEATWTHAGPSETPETLVHVAVGGDLTVGVGATIQAGTGSDNGRYVSRGYVRGKGPGHLRRAGASFAGEGGHVTNTTGFVSYGSILDPLSYGSGGYGDSNNYAGGGIVKLTVGGTLTVDGAIQSRGFGYALNNDYVGGAGSGGSVNITAGALAGSGRIDANGGANGLYGPGSGGRVKIELTGETSTFAAFTGVVEAVGGSMQNETNAGLYDVSPAAAGTVCLRTAADDAPTVRVCNAFRYGTADAPWRVADGEAIPSATHLPAMRDGDDLKALRATKWELSGRGALRLTADVKIGSLALASADGAQCVYTEGRTLTVRGLTVAGEKKATGVYTAADLPGIVVGSGAIEVRRGDGFAVFVR